MSKETKDFEAITEQRVRLREAHNVLFDSITAILYELDPVGIGVLDNPDEYDVEVGTILPRLGSCNSVDEVHEVVFEEFLSWFSVSSVGAKSKYEEAARLIWEIWQQSGKPSMNE